MSPSILKTRQCPHCKALVPEPTPRVCPQCAGSLQRRFLSIGCLSSAPPVVILALGLRALALHAGPPAHLDREKGAVETSQPACGSELTPGAGRDARARLQCLAAIPR